MQQKHILVVDDNKDLLFMISAMLKINGYQVSSLENTTGIETVVIKIQPDLIMMDMLLSGSDGREICRQLKSNKDTASVPVLMLSAHPQAAENCIAAGADRFIEKPFEMQHLLDTLHTLLNS